MPEGEFIYSRTDLKGVITEANEAFWAAQRFYARRDGRAVAQHHASPGHASAAFEDLWRDMKAGRPWRGIVKNRRKDGGFTVVANASPVRERTDRWLSVARRGRPSKEEIAAASAAYKRISDSDSSIYVEHGRVVRKGPELVNSLLSLRSQMTLAGLAAIVPPYLVAPLLGISVLAGVTTCAIGAAALLSALYFLLIYTPGVEPRPGCDQRVDRAHPVDG